MKSRLSFQRTISSIESMLVAMESSSLYPGIGSSDSESRTSVFIRPRQESVLMWSWDSVTSMGFVVTLPHSMPPLSETKPSRRRRAMEIADESR